MFIFLQIFCVFFFGGGGGGGVEGVQWKEHSLPAADVSPYSYTTSPHTDRVSFTSQYHKAEQKK